MTNQKNTWSIVLAVVIIAVTLGGVYYWQTQNSTATGDRGGSISEEEQQKMQDIIDADQQAQNIIYTNATYGFTLTFPSTWKGYTAKNRTLSWGSDRTDSIDFGFADQDSIFNISVFSQSQWKRIKSGEGPTPIYLGETNQYVFGYNTAQDVVNNTMVARMGEVNDIVKTFTLLPPVSSSLEKYTNSTYGFEFSYPSKSTIETTGDSNAQYMRLQNYIPTDDRSGLAAGEYYLEIHIADRKKGHDGLASCTESVVDAKEVELGVATGYRGYGQVGGDAGGIRFALCAERSGVDYYIVGTENDQNAPLVNAIFDSFIFTK